MDTYQRYRLILFWQLVDGHNKNCLCVQITKVIMITAIRVRREMEIKNN